MPSHKMKGIQPAWEEGEAIWPSLTKGIEPAVGEMDILSDLAMIAWTRKKENVRAKQARKASMVYDGNEFEERVFEKSNNSGRKKSTRESKRDRDLVGGSGGVRVGDAVETVKMEVELEKLATRQAKDEARARRNTQKNRKKGVQ